MIAKNQSLTTCRTIQLMSHLIQDGRLGPRVTSMSAETQDTCWLTSLSEGSNGSGPLFDSKVLYASADESATNA